LNKHIWLQCTVNRANGTNENTTIESDNWNSSV